MLTAPAETYHRDWSPLLDELAAEQLDCLQSNLAVLLDHHRGPGAHVVLGSAPRFDTTTDQRGVPRLAAGLADRLAQAHDLAGLRVARRFDDVAGPRLAELAAEHGTLYVVADVHDLPWTPYAGRRHEEHSFLLCTDGAGTCVVDAYHDETPWGPARPGTWRLDPSDVDALPRGTALVLAIDDTAPVPVRHRDNAAAARSSADEFVDRGGAAPDTLVQDVWLLGRSRSLYATWLASLPDTPAAVLAAAQAHAEAVTALGGRLFLAGRRGGGPSDELLDALRALLRADAELVIAVAAGTAAAEATGESSVDDDAVTAVVVAAIATVLGVDEAEVRAAGSLRELAGFNSFRLVEIIERAEGALGVELTDEDLTPDTLTRTGALCAAFARRRPR
ncbi:acyl carrier protein [Labedaea rhizosphaerae]|uniref:Acyl carrier protein n=1 Tax=Labedaea rhizosphaerae TaxID=598644 RepID=A0A4R6S048_LABRH|nr:acyl carrier protein [Labedaea rhizosphaerae]TDP92851.1 acyl carrier protein [Labedaea rhizosphaerae]